MNGRRWAALIIAGGLFLVSIAYQIATTKESNVYGNLIGGEMFEEHIMKEGTGEHKIAVVPLDGAIQDLTDSPLAAGYNHKEFLNMLDQAGSDPFVDGVIIRVNSPGGGVVESAEIHDKVVDIQEQYEKPVYVSMGNTAASGGYYVAAPADKIVAHPATLTGSIGVIMESINISEFADNHGIDFQTIKSGKHKDILSMSRDMTEDEEKILQSMIDEMYEDFVDVIVAGRDMPEDEVKKISDGRVYTGKQAYELDLVDELGSLEDTIAMLEEDYQLNDAIVVQYEQAFGLSNFFSMSFNEMFRSDVDLQEVVNTLRSTDGPRAMYLYTE
ncbi:MAG TPA: signal peptide peptidase SppA [Bacillota bacterium]|nr:signal peptide peptidase SppA [Bacillota bacterium]